MLSGTKVKIFPSFSLLKLVICGFWYAFATKTERITKIYHNTNSADKHVPPVVKTTSIHTLEPAMSNMDGSQTSHVYRLADRRKTCEWSPSIPPYCHHTATHTLMASGRRENLEMKQK